MTRAGDGGSSSCERCNSPARVIVSWCDHEPGTCDSDCPERQRVVLCEDCAGELCQVLSIAGQGQHTIVSPLPRPVSATREPQGRTIVCRGTAGDPVVFRELPGHWDDDDCAEYAQSVSADRPGEHLAVWDDGVITGVWVGGIPV